MCFNKALKLVINNHGGKIMKKLLTLLGLTAVAGTLAISTAVNQKAKETKAVDYE